MRRPSMTAKGKTSISLNVYDIIESNIYTYAWGLGAFHSGIVFGGVEYSFAGGAGIFTSPPKQAQGAVFRETIEMGLFEGTYRDARRVIDDMRSEFDGSQYNLLTKNCNTFANEACLRLIGEPIPAYINRIAYFGSCFSCLIPRQLIGEAPVQGDETTSSSSYVKSATYGSTNIPVFSGEGITLQTTPTTSLLSATDDDEASRRERRVAAAIKRLEMNSSNEPTD